MKAILLTSILLLGACATTPTVKSLAGTYQAEKDGDVGRLVLLENGILSFMMMEKKKKGKVCGK